MTPLSTRFLNLRDRLWTMPRSRGTEYNHVYENIVSFKADKKDIWIYSNKERWLGLQKGNITSRDFYDQDGVHLFYRICLANHYTIDGFYAFIEFDSRFPMSVNFFIDKDLKKFPHMVDWGELSHNWEVHNADKQLDEFRTQKLLNAILTSFEGWLRRGA